MEGCFASSAATRKLKGHWSNVASQWIAWRPTHDADKQPKEALDWELDAIPGIGPALTTALVASVADAKAFRLGRNFSAWIGLVPKQHSRQAQAWQYQ